MIPRHAPVHGNECICVVCESKRARQYDAQKEHWATRLPPTPIDQIGPLLERSNALVRPLREEIDTLKYILLAILHGTDKLREDIEGEMWEDEIYASTVRKLKALADEDNERKAMRA